MKLWSGRLSGSMDATFALLNNSLPFDKRLAEVDVRGSIAWAHALGRAGVLKQAEADQIVTGLEAILAEFEAPNLFSKRAMRISIPPWNAA